MGDGIDYDREMGDMADEWVQEQELDRWLENHPFKIKEMAQRYQMNRLTKVGQAIRCACCGKTIPKVSYQKQFCSNKGVGNCKDTFWNMIDPKRWARMLTQNNVDHDHWAWDLAETMSKPDLTRPNRTKDEVLKELQDTTERLKELHIELASFT